MRLSQSGRPCPILDKHLSRMQAQAVADVAASAREAASLGYVRTRSSGLGHAPSCLRATAASGCSKASGRQQQEPCVVINVSKSSGIRVKAGSGASSGLVQATATFSPPKLPALSMAITDISRL